MRDWSDRKLRSHDWFQPHDKKGFTHRSWMRSQGLPSHLFDGRPVIGICNTWSELTPCNAGLRQLAEHVKRGVFEAGGFPLEFPVMSMGETLMRPSSMMFRNLVSMDVESSLRANPLDGVVLLAGCDKTTPALLMGAASCDLPSIMVSAGPMLRGVHRGQYIGSGTHIFKFADEVAAGTMSSEAFMAAEAGMARSAGTCMTMGTAATMASIAEAMGVAPPDNASIPAADTGRRIMAHMAGIRIVEMVWDDCRISQFLTREAFENAIRVTAAIGGSTNAVIHLLALAGRAGVVLDLDDWDALGRDVPMVVNLMPAGEFLMEDFYEAGGLRAVMAEVRDHLHLDVPTVSGRTLGDNIADAASFRPDVIRPAAKATPSKGALAVLKGSLAPDGAVIKTSAASPHLLQHIGRAVVFEDVDDFRARIDDPDLDVEERDILVLKNCGPRGYPGFPEVGNFRLPAKVLRQGVRDMVRISDARMSGTAFGTVILHVAPEAASAGPLAFVRTGDRIEIDHRNRRLDLLVDADEMAERQKQFRAPRTYERGYERLYQEHVMQAHQGADFDFLVGSSGAPIPKDSH